MSHITTGVEYALHSLLYLAGPHAESRQASARELAEYQDIPTDFIKKIFTRLQKAGLVSSTEGVKGGFRLAKPPAEISVWDVIVAVDGEKKLFDCRDIRSRCLVFKGRPPGWATTGVCAIHAVMLEAEAAMRRMLRSRTLADIAAKLDSKATRPPTLLFDEWLAENTAPRPAGTAHLESDRG